jgi:hypothetical protein
MCGYLDGVVALVGAVDGRRDAGRGSMEDAL